MSMEAIGMMSIDSVEWTASLRIICSMEILPNERAVKMIRIDTMRPLTYSIRP